MIANRFLWAAVPLLLVCCSVPVRDYTVEQIGVVEKLDELMHVQATVADPRFKLAAARAGQDLTDEEWGQFADMGTRLTATVRRIAKFSKGADFDRWNAQLGDQAARLRRLVRERQRDASLQLVGEMRKTCADCHRQFK